MTCPRGFTSKNPAPHPSMLYSALDDSVVQPAGASVGTGSVWVAILETTRERGQGNEGQGNDPGMRVRGSGTKPGITVSVPLRSSPVVLLSSVPRPLSPLQGYSVSTRHADACRV